MTGGMFWGKADIKCLDFNHFFKGSVALDMGMTVHLSRFTVCENLDFILLVFNPSLSNPGCLTVTVIWTDLETPLAYKL